MFAVSVNRTVVSHTFPRSLIILLRCLFLSDKRWKKDKLKFDIPEPGPPLHEVHEAGESRLELDLTLKIRARPAYWARNNAS